MENLLRKHDRITRVAWKYHKEGLTQQKIADKMGISRFKVMDLLSEAKAQGIVEVRINSPFYNCLSIESRLVKEFNLQEAVVVPGPNNVKELRKVIAIGGSSYLEDLIKSGDKIGAGWGRTLFEMIKWFPFQNGKYEDVSVVLMWGGLTSEALSLAPYDVANTLADKVEGACYYIFAPAIVGSKELRDAILADEKIKSALEEARSVDKALVGIGQTNSQASLVHTGYISEEEMEELRNKGAVGEILGRFFDIKGEPVESEIDELIIGLDLKEISEIEKVIGFAGGEDKVKSIYGALEGGYIDVLVTDEETAEGVLNLKSS